VSRAVAVLLALALPAVPATTAAQPQTTLLDLEDEVMCPICGTLLQLSDSPQAQRERAFITRLIAAGKSKAEIKDALVAEYGRDVLALPDDSGFDLSAYLVPIAAFAIATAAIGVAVVRRRRTRPVDEPSPATSDPTDRERLDADMAKYRL
jgi:cytochrome c-type biogenesis protein CcmH/NrfF